MGKRNPVLYIDDAESNLLVAKVSLNDIGIPVHCAKSAKEGISNSQAEAYSLILCDIQLPDATGFEVLRAIRSIRGINQFSPVVVFTADISIENRIAMLEHGFTDFIGKPFKVKALQQKVEIFLEDIADLTPDFSYYKQFVSDSQRSELNRAISNDLRQFETKFFLAWGQHDYESARRQLHHLELLVSNLKLVAMKKLIDDLRTEKAITKQSSLAAVKLHRHLLHLMENFS